jgi:flagellar protein FliS
MSIASKHYQKQALTSQVAIATPNELVILVYEKTFDNLKLGMNEMLKGSYGIEYFSRATDLINQGLLATLNYEKGKDIALELKNIYEWCIKEILAARLEKSPQRISQVIQVLTPLYEGWVGISPKNNINYLSPIQELPPAVGKNSYYSIT